MLNRLSQTPPGLIPVQQAQPSAQPSQAKINHQASLTGGSANLTGQTTVVRDAHKESAMAMVREQRSKKLLLAEANRVNQPGAKTGTKALSPRSRKRDRDEEGTAEEGDGKHDDESEFDAYDIPPDILDG